MPRPLCSYASCPVETFQIRFRSIEAGSVDVSIFSKATVPRVLEYALRYGEYYIHK